MDYINDFETLSSQFSEKEIKKLQLPLLIRFINKLKDNNIEDYEINTKMTELLTCLDDIYRDYKQQRKIYNKTLRSLMNYVQKTYGLIAKGTQIGLWLAIGVALGPTFGVVLIATNPAFIGIGTGVGLAIGVAIGTSFEKKAEKEGKLY